jgi:hypothetical protein
MALIDWIAKYPQVQRLLQHPEDVLDYAPDNAAAAAFVPDERRRLDFTAMTRAEAGDVFVRFLENALAEGRCYILDEETPVCVRSWERFMAWTQTHTTVLAEATYGAYTIRADFRALRAPHMLLSYDWETSLVESTPDGGMRVVGRVYREKAEAMAVYEAARAQLATGGELDPSFFQGPTV